jgi:hypothetical protein
VTNSYAGFSFGLTSSMDCGKVRACTVCNSHQNGHQITKGPRGGGAPGTRGLEPQVGFGGPGTHGISPGPHFPLDDGCEEMLHVCGHAEDAR